MALLLPLGDKEPVPLAVALTVPVRLPVALVEAEEDDDPVLLPEAVGVKVDTLVREGETVALLLPLVDEDPVPLAVALPVPDRLAVAQGVDEEDEDPVALLEGVGEKVVTLDRLAESVTLPLPLVVPLALAV